MSNYPLPVQKSRASVRASASTRSSTSPKSSSWWSSAGSSTTSDWCPSAPWTATTSSGSKWPTPRPAPPSPRAYCGPCTGRKPPSSASALPSNDRYIPPPFFLHGIVDVYDPNALHRCCCLKSHGRKRATSVCTTSCYRRRRSV